MTYNYIVNNVKSKSLGRPNGTKR